MMLSEGGHGGATYELVGTIGLSQNDVAATTSVVLGRTIRIEQDTIAAWEARSAARRHGRVWPRRARGDVSLLREHGLAGNPATLYRLLAERQTISASFLPR